VSGPSAVSEPVGSEPADAGARADAGVAEQVAVAPAGPGRPPGKRDTATLILDAAENLFAERGFDATSLRDIAGAVGIRVPSLYNHFGNKDELYRAVLARAWKPLFEVIDPDRRGYADDVIANSMALLIAHPNVIRLLYREALHDRDHLADLRTDWIEPMFQQTIDQLANSTSASHRWSDDELPLLYVAMYNVFLGWFVTARLFGEALGVDPSSPEGLDRQVRFLQKLWSTLWV